MQFEGTVNFVLILTRLLGSLFIIFIFFIKFGLAVDLRALTLRVFHQPLRFI